MISLPCIRTLVSGCKLQLRLLINVLGSCGIGGGASAPVLERLLSCIRNAHPKARHRSNSGILSLMSLLGQGGTLPVVRA